MDARANSSEEARAILERLPPDIARILEHAASLRPLYLVGGNVRDALLSFDGAASSGELEARDLDLVTEEPAQSLGEALREVFGGDLTCHDAFMTCTLSLPDYRCRHRNGERRDLSLSGLAARGQKEHAGARPLPP